MRIESSSKAPLRFSDINEGSVFRFGTTIFMKIYAVDGYNAACLLDGDLHKIESGAGVVVVEGRFVCD